MMLFTSLMAASGGAPPAGVPDSLAGGPVAVMARIRGGSRGAPALWGWSGLVFGRRRDELARPLLQVTGIGFSRLARRDDGRWELAMSEAGYMADLATGELLREWRNPYTGAVVSPPPNRLVLRYVIADDGRITPPLPGMDFDGLIGPLRVSGDTVWVSERLMARMPSSPANQRPTGPTGNPVEFSTFQARRSDLDDPDIATVPATMHHQAVWGFYSWMGMDAQPGDIMTQISGRKLSGADEVAQPLRERLERDYPGLLASPAI